MKSRATTGSPARSESTSLERVSGRSPEIEQVQRMIIAEELLKA